MTKKHEISNFFAEKKKFSDLQNLHPGVFLGAEADFEGPRAPGGPGGGPARRGQGSPPGPAQGVGGMA